MPDAPNSVTIALVGCGHMGSALLTSWLNSFIADNYIVINPSPLPTHFNDEAHITHLTSAADLTATPDIVVLAVKPQIMDEVCTDIPTKYIKNSLIISIAAGQEIKSLENSFSSDHSIARVMPNTPAAIGQGMSIGVCNEHVTAAQKQQIASLFTTAGKFEWIDDENLMHAVTAVSGSGPAYLFHLIECLQGAAVDVGLPPELSEKLARQTIIGAASLAAYNTDIDAQTLRHNVTSPGGTTEAALQVLMGDDMMKSLLTRAVKAAQNRGKDLS